MEELHLKDFPAIAEKLYPDRKAYVLSFGPRWFVRENGGTREVDQEKFSVELDDPNFSCLARKITSAVEQGFLQKLSSSNIEKLTQTAKVSDGNPVAKILKNRVMGLIRKSGEICFQTNDSLRRDDVCIFFSSHENAIKAAQVIMGQLPNTFEIVTHDPLEIVEIELLQPLVLEPAQSTFDLTLTKMSFETLLELNNQPFDLQLEYFDPDGININYAVIAEIETN